MEYFQQRSGRVSARKVQTRQIGGAKVCNDREELKVAALGGPLHGPYSIGT